ncbi:MAG TPA: hypothetical protein D7I00_03005 [Candidatus Poseidoniales archaeon]|nr:MAG TPA: hypothetical protein D7I00_03005 [Candidatus Poseidoniales archaeon]HII24707.1 hypothetical protein [Candidatus Poseidoniaceae archaeon]
MVRVSVHPIDGSIAQSFIQRLLMFDVTICLHKEDSQRIQERYATLLEAGIANVESSHRAEMNFVFFSEENTITINDSSTVVLHDVLPSGRNNGMVNAGLDSIWSQIETTNDNIGSHFWVAESDVVDALVRIALNQPALPSRIDIAGRRRWSTQQSHHELQMLHGRTQAGTTGKFTASLLDQPASPEISVVPIRSEEQTPRPSLGPLHDVLIECDGHGWQPTSPLRTAMMVYLAGKLND